MNLIMGHLRPISGGVVVNSGLRIGHFTQHHSERFDLSLSAIENMLNIFNSAEDQVMRSFLGRFQIQGADALKPMRYLSGGMATKTDGWSWIPLSQYSNLSNELVCCSFFLQGKRAELVSLSWPTNALICSLLTKGPTTFPWTPWMPLFRRSRNLKVRESVLNFVVYRYHILPKIYRLLLSISYITFWFRRSHGCESRPVFRQRHV